MNKSKGSTAIQSVFLVIFALAAASGWYFYYLEQSETLAIKEAGNENQRILNDSLTKAKNENSLLSEELRSIRAEKEEIENKMQQEVKKIASTTADLERELQQRQMQQQSLSETVSEVSGEKNQLIASLETEQNRRLRLQQQIANVSSDIEQKEEALSEAKQDVSELNQSLVQTQLEQEQLKTEFEALNREREADSQHFAELKDRLEQELDESRVQISQLKNRMTVIKLTNEVLFSSGSAEIKPAGKKVLSFIAASLNNYPKRAISIEGHTDNIPVGKSSSYRSNWELSSARAQAAVDFFQKSNQVDPTRMKVVGYGEFSSIASNDTAEGRKLNRRIEIRLLPELEEVE